MHAFLNLAMHTAPMESHILRDFTNLNTLSALARHECDCHINLISPQMPEAQPRGHAARVPQAI